MLEEAAMEPDDFVNISATRGIGQVDSAGQAYDLAGPSITENRKRPVRKRQAND